MTTRATPLDHPSPRRVVALPRTYDASRERYETLVPEAALARFFQMASWPATLELAEVDAPHGLMRYYRSDITAAAMAGSPHWPSLSPACNSPATATPDRRRRPRTRRPPRPADHLLGGDTPHTGSRKRMMRN
jgi:hypothetical protein